MTPKAILWLAYVPVHAYLYTHNKNSGPWARLLFYHTTYYMQCPLAPGLISMSGTGADRPLLLSDILDFITQEDHVPTRQH